MNQSLFSYWLLNVRLETSYRFDDGIVTGTETGLFHVRIENGVFAEIRAADDAPDTTLPTRDAQGDLLLPSLRDMHIHLDKTYYGGPWKAPVRMSNGIFSRIEEEQKLLPQLLPTAKQRAEGLMELLIRYGSTHIRAHCNVDPVIGLQNLEATLQVVEAYREKAYVELVAFPQHGLLRSQSVSLVREALRNGATIVGGLDPATVDENMEKSLNATMELAVEGNAGIDIHLHEPSHIGLNTVKRLADLTEEAGWQGRVALSHAFTFADVSSSEVEEVAARLAHLGISVVSSLSLSRTIPIPQLQRLGVNVSLGQDSITDHWSPFGNGDNLDKVGTLAERFNLWDERSLGQTLGYVTGGITPLDPDGQYAWPQVGDAANALLVKASCSAEAVARRSQRSVVLYKGTPVYGTL
ncbi:amidohydrolase family protein [Paenibacillus sp. JCM 10914]|uniref:amidohydrolase n=1 Tax=Paenibacillus sp. JCM 10914 TaxID=1236974 RepID=UPI0003CC9F3A|nr:amidohydrolase [Paenibacillus sp. JCM 10914]GAE07060.1 cytosine deaminase [Paenibacillus sp. JCM 10914]